ncbi:MAG: hypothetical protein M1821_007668 [Bathelium mastoideum]|nr:MAG: hypothetical protein M1821_007668 [Bathelium mastoideum]
MDKDNRDPLQDGTRTKSLCESCRNLDFEQVFTHTVIPETGAIVKTLGKQSSSAHKISCKLCRFFHKLGPAYSRKYTLHVRLFDHIRGPKRGGSAHGDFSKQISGLPFHRFLTILRQNARTTYDYRVQREIESAGLICYVPYQASRAQQLRVIDATNVDWEPIKVQLEHCSIQHHVCKLDHDVPGHLPSIFFLDCVREAIVPGNLSDQYLALSYVWGRQKEEVDDKSTDFFSLQDAPLTIRDAAKVVLALGRRYLWVDRYCIDQNNALQKDTAIHNMDHIYESADATIVALYGDNHEDGLPGVSTTPRTAQPCFDTGNGRLVYSFPTITTLIATSKWNTRGWTYQEARMSRRCLFFTSHQIYLVCRHSTWSEVVPFKPTMNSVTELLNSGRLDGALFGYGRSIAGELLIDRAEYSKRDLTSEADRLDAFRGILRRSPFITFWGIPVKIQNSITNANISFALDLLWFKRPEWAFPARLRTQRRELSARRSGFPTWSWASLRAEIYQENYPPQLNYYKYISGTDVCFPHNEADIQFWCCRYERLLSLQEMVRIETSTILPEHSPNLLVEGEFVSLRCKHRGNAHERYDLFGEWWHFEPDLSDELRDDPGSVTQKDSEHEVQALVLVQWQETQKHSGTKRLLLMMVKWLDENHAERRGLLTQYWDEFPSHLIGNLRRTRRRFILQ